MLENKRLQEILKFGVNGVVCFVIDYGVMILLTECFGVYYLISAGISFTLSVIVNYIICVRWVFDNASNTGKKAKMIFIGSSIAGLGLNQLLMWFLVDLIGIFYMIAKIISTLIVMVWNYVMKRKALVEDK